MFYDDPELDREDMDYIGKQWSIYQKDCIAKMKEVLNYPLYLAPMYENRHAWCNFCQWRFTVYGERPNRK